MIGSAYQGFQTGCGGCDYDFEAKVLDGGGTKTGATFVNTVRTVIEGTWP